MTYLAKIRAERLAAYGVAHPNAEELDALDERDWLRVLDDTRARGKQANRAAWELERQAWREATR